MNGNSPLLICLHVLSYKHFIKDCLRYKQTQHNTSLHNTFPISKINVITIITMAPISEVFKHFTVLH